MKDRILRSRVDATRQLVSAIGGLRHKPSVLVSASAVGYYGDRGAEILTETSGPGAGFLADVCVGWEREAQRAAEFGLRVVSYNCHGPWTRWRRSAADAYSVSPWDRRPFRQR